MIWLLPKQHFSVICRRRGLDQSHYREVVQWEISMKYPCFDSVLRHRIISTTYLEINNLSDIFLEPLKNTVLPKRSSIPVIYLKVLNDTKLILNDSFGIISISPVLQTNNWIITLFWKHSIFDWLYYVPI